MRTTHAHAAGLGCLGLLAAYIVFGAGGIELADPPMATHSAPLLAMWNRFWELIPVGELAWRYRLGEIVGAMLALYLLARLVEGLVPSGGAPGALVACLTLGTGASFYAAATAPDGSSVYALVTVGVLLAMRDVADRGGARRGLFACFALGLAVGTPLPWLLAPPFAALLLFRLYRGARFPLLAPTLWALGLAGAVAFDTILGGRLRWPVDALSSKSHDVFMSVPAFWGTWLVALCCIGWIFAGRGRQARWVGLAALWSLIAAVWLGDETLVLAATCVLFVGLGCAAAWLSAQFSHAAPAAAGVLALVLATKGASETATTALRHRQGEFARAWAEAELSGLPPRACAVVSESAEWLRQVEAARPDVSMAREGCVATHQALLESADVPPGALSAFGAMCAVRPPQEGDLVRATRNVETLLLRYGDASDNTSEIRLAALTELAVRASMRGDTGLAVRLLDGALRHRPGHVPALVARGELALAQGHVPTGCAYAEHATRISPDEPLAAVLLFRCHVARADYEAAEDALRALADSSVPPAQIRSLGQELRRRRRGR